MIITRSMTPYGAETLEKLKKELSEREFLEKQKWSRGYSFDLDRDLQKLRDNFPEYDGEVFDQNGKKTEEYQININKLKELNNETVGYIAVEGTKISYPIVKAKDNEFFQG